MSYNSISPPHYHGDRKYEPIAVIEDWQLNYRLGNAVKYIARNGRKPGEDPTEGLKKAIWYIEREIESLQASSQYAPTYEDVLEDYAACKAAEALQKQYDLWDPTVGPVEPDPIEQVPPHADYTGQAEWDSKQECYVLKDIHEDLDAFESTKIVRTFERRGLIMGVDKEGRCYVLGTDENA